MPLTTPRLTARVDYAPMLSLRMIIFAGLGAIALWGLFNLLDNLREPGLLRTAKGVAVKGCDSLDDHADAPRLCPQLFCQKALFDRKLAEPKSTFNMTLDRAEADERLIGGEIVGHNLPFVCTLRGLQVIDAKTVSAEEFAGFAAQ